MLCDHLVFASVGVAEHAEHQEGVEFVDAVASVGEGVQGASVGWDRVSMGQIAEVLGEKLKMLVDVQSGEASA